MSATTARWRLACCLLAACSVASEATVSSAEVMLREYEPEELAPGPAQAGDREPPTRVRPAAPPPTEEWIGLLAQRMEELAAFSRSPLDGLIAGDLPDLRAEQRSADHARYAAQVELAAGREQAAIEAVHSALQRLSRFQHLGGGGRTLESFLDFTWRGSNPIHGVYVLRREERPAIELIYIPEQTFPMGSNRRPSEGPVHERTVERGF